MFSTSKLQSYEQSPSYKTLESFREYLKEAESWNQKTLVLFDVDGVIIASSDPFARANDVEAKYKELVSAYVGKSFDQKMWHKLHVTLWQLAEFQLIEKDFTSFIEHLHHKSIPVFALTAIETGPYGAHENMALWRSQMLLSHGVYFSTLISNQKFENLPHARNQYPCIYEGVICTNGVAKGLVLEEFLKKLPFKPERIVFFDDMVKNLICVEKICQKNKIPCSLFHYIGAQNRIPVIWNAKANADKIKKILSQSYIHDDSRYF